MHPHSSSVKLVNYLIVEFSKNIIYSLSNHENSIKRVARGKTLRCIFVPHIIGIRHGLLKGESINSAHIFISFALNKILRTKTNRNEDEKARYFVDAKINAVECQR